ncbi:uncharacterized protein VTP21DRAFT_10706 [Calcarisporiella thermophila]|uniref:uncharacterized protein n=1 Tax=Calcarisporiella thermophila TaxID=911321 RepID=UPI0037439913
MRSTSSSPKVCSPSSSSQTLVKDGKQVEYSSVDGHCWHDHSETTPLKSSRSSTSTYLSIHAENIPFKCPQNNMTDDPKSRRTKRRLTIAILVSFIFFIAELVGGYFANSLALMSDAFHLLADVASFVVALIAIKLSEMPATKRHSFGYHRAEVLAAILSAISIWALTGWLVHEAINRIRNPQPIDGKTMSIVSGIGIAVNVILMLVLGTEHHHHGHSHSHCDSNHTHAHGENHHYHEHSEEGKMAENHHKTANLNVRAATLHVIGDLIFSIGVFISSVIILLDPSKNIIDPICTFIFSVIVLFTTYRLVSDSLSILMEGTPAHINPQDVQETLQGIDGVRFVHDLHIWALTAGKTSLSVHLLIADRDDHGSILAEAQKLLCELYDIHHTVIQVEAVCLAHCIGSCASILY